MRIVHHLEHLEPCPFLPAAAYSQTAAALRRFGSDRGVEFYQAALTTAQSLWLQGLPAQAILLLNRAFGADLQGDETELVASPLPYRAVGWIMRARTEDQFIGNPRRHFQHLATRMVEPRKELRTWRAWGCWRLARLAFPNYPADEEQLANEGVFEPSAEIIAQQLLSLGLPGEVDWWRRAEADCLGLGSDPG